MLNYKITEADVIQAVNVNKSIPDNHLWILSLSERYWGIHKRAQEFFEELNNPDSNRRRVIDLLVDVSISDFWIYKESLELGKCTKIFLEIFDTLLGEELSDELAKRLVYLYLEFFSNNNDCFIEDNHLSGEFFQILRRNFRNNFLSYISNISSFKKDLSKAALNPSTEESVMTFMQELAKTNIVYWESTTNIEKWLSDNKDKMSDDYSQSIKSLDKNFFDLCHKKLDEAKTWDSLCNTTFTFSDIIDALRDKIDEFKKASEQFCYISYLLSLPGMVNHKAYLLTDLNRAIKRLTVEMDEEQCIQSIDDLFILFHKYKESHINIILDSILTSGKEIINTRNKKLIHHIENQIINFGFIAPGVTYLTEDWELKVNPNHVRNIRVWLELIEYDPETMKQLLSALIINLRVGGIFIFDSDFLQKDVTNLLNSKISPLYKQIKQLSRIFPVYFSEIGAEGYLRDISTRIDEITHRNDKLIHFLRKQIHTEGNNSHVHITLEIIRFWLDFNKTRLKDIVPQNVLDTIDVENRWVKGVHDVLKKIISVNNCSLDEVLEKDKEDIRSLLSNIKHDDANDMLRVSLIIELYQLLKDKYKFETNKILTILKSYHFIESKKIEELELYFASSNHVEALKLIYSLMVQLNEIIFDPKISEGWETVIYKRHIAFGIPSMYGYYRESKFEALGLTFRLEKIASNLVSKIISEIHTDYFSAKNLKNIYSVIQLLREGLSIDGIYDQGLDSNIKMFQYSLTSGSFTIKQYINIFQFMEGSIKKIINKYFIRPYDQLLNIIIPQYIPPGKSIRQDSLKKTVVQKSEIFYRELLSSAFIIQAMDNFIGEILNNLRKLINNLSDAEIQSIITYDSDIVISPIYQDTPAIDNQVFLGSKAYYLKKLSLNNYPVPPGFVITTEVFRRVDLILKLHSLSSEIDNMVLRHIVDLERISGLKYGDPEKPLLLSVRSGAAISMPGAMNTFLNVGLNDEITERLSKQDNYAWTSWDCYRRLLQTWGMANGLTRNDFDQIILNYKQQYNISQKIDFPPKVMKEIAFAYKQLLSDNGIEFESDPFLQIKKAIISVFNSWDTPRAKVYRGYMNIADEWGTAVIVQQMIFGNLHKESGSGVLFTHDMQDDVSGIRLAGDFSFLSQGEDIVAGLINTLPISEKQRIKYYRKNPYSLETAFPKIYNKLKEISHELIEVHGFGHQEIEFTFETAEPEDLYILQTRDMTIVKQDKIEIFASSEKKMQSVGYGIGIGNKVLNGVIVFDLEDLVILKKEDPFKNAVLVRPDTVPDDIEMILECEGLLTSRGGATSHAAVTAASLGKTGVVNCDDMVVFEKEKKCIINGNIFVSFDTIAIDGNKGIIYKGNYPIKFQEL